MRKEKGWSQEKLSDVAHLDRDYVGKVERGQVNVSVDTLAMLAKALGKQLLDFLEPGANPREERK